MYVCLCNGISDKKIRQAVRQFFPSLVPAIKKNLFRSAISAVNVSGPRVK